MSTVLLASQNLMSWPMVQSSMFIQQSQESYSVLKEMTVPSSTSEVFWDQYEFMLELQKTRVWATSCGRHWKHWAASTWCKHEQSGMLQGSQWSEDTRFTSEHARPYASVFEQHLASLTLPKKPCLQTVERPNRVWVCQQVLQLLKITSESWAAQSTLDQCLY